MVDERTVKKIEHLAAKGKFEKVLSYATSKHAPIRAAVAKAIAQTRVDESYNMLITMLRDSDISVRRQAIISLGELGRASAVSHVSHFAENTDDAELKALCSEAIAKIHANKNTF
ncbi:MAG: HEAT repeat domain-containing protein [Oscillospiraceae bacterium]|nr:HEAT repeat domain-containing protein [Oscillospiraceae bacterium]